MPQASKGANLRGKGGGGCAVLCPFCYTGFAETVLLIGRHECTMWMFSVCRGWRPCFVFARGGISWENLTGNTRFWVHAPLVVEPPPALVASWLI